MFISIHNNYIEFEEKQINQKFLTLKDVNILCHSLFIRELSMK